MSVRAILPHMDAPFHRVPSQGHVCGLGQSCFLSLRGRGGRSFRSVRAISTCHLMPPGAHSTSPSRKLGTSCRMSLPAQSAQLPPRRTCCGLRQGGALPLTPSPCYRRQVTSVWQRGYSPATSCDGSVAAVCPFARSMVSSGVSGAGALTPRHQHCCRCYRPVTRCVEHVTPLSSLCCGTVLS